MRSTESASSWHLPMNSADSLVSLTPLSVLVVEPQLDELLLTVETLAAAGFHVTATSSYDEAKPIVSSHPPQVLVTAVRLGVYNGLHLVLRGKGLRSEMAALVTSPCADPVLQADATLMGATFIVRPIAAKELVAAVLQTYFRRNTVAPVLPPFERRLSDRRARPGDFEPERRIAERRRYLPWLIR